MILFLLNYQILGNGLDCLQYLHPQMQEKALSVRIALVLLASGAL